MKLRLEKGTYRYRTAHKKRQLFFVVLFILAIVAQLILRNFITEQFYKNLVTIIGFLTVLPMANLGSPFMPVDAAVVHPTGVYLYCTIPKVDRKKAEKFLNEMLVGWKLDGNAKVMNEEKKFLRRLSELKNVTEEEDDGSAPHVLKLLKSLSM